MSDELIGSALIWLATYLVHSSLLLGGVWLFLTIRRGAGDAVREALWRAALLGGILTASTQWAMGFHTFSGSIEVSWLSTASASGDDAASGPQAAPTALPAEPGTAATVTPAISSETAIEPHPAVEAANGDWRWRFGVAMVIVALFSAPATVLSWLRLNRLLGTRVPVPDGPLAAMFDRLARTARLRRRILLTHSKSIRSPVAFGVCRREVCLPSRVLTELTPAQQQSMLAHELAHHVRHDPFWLSVSRLIVSVLFFQPLNRVAARQLQEIAEFRCDAWAIERTGDDLPLAQCLASVAGWMVRPNRSLAGQPIAAMAASESVLRRRIARIVDDQPRDRHNRGPALAIVIAALLIAASVAPAINTRAGEVPLAGDSPDTTPAHTPLLALDASTGEVIELLATQIDLLREELNSIREALNRAPREETESLRERLDTLAGAMHSLRERANLLRNLWLMTSGEAAPAAPTNPGGHHRLTDRSIR